ncbi:hypothetical protein RRG08_004695 [Elysia crispata]|uniref:PiggyBac transposable element-derived protein 4 C-terminal zinc-finger domain-containing protein n=1 Tax=Elysia crispata TaxID=231223 RepID=A0AAE1AT37_9GAST|nr:hypothetical protein RRG08_004695 [Elysia crispata]
MAAGRWCEKKSAPCSIQKSPDLAAHRSGCRELPLPVPAVQRLAPETHFMETVKQDRNCRVCSMPRQRKRTTNTCSVCPGKPHLCRKDCFKIWHTRLNLSV